MSTQQTKLDVCNLALDVIREPAAASLDTSTPPLRMLLRNYDHVVDTTLRSYPWGFAKERFERAAEAHPPVYGWRYRYSIPNNVLRILPITENGLRGGAIVPVEIVGRYIETDHAAPLRFTGIVRRPDPGTWEPLFLEIVRCSLALLMANKFTNKARYVDTARELLREARAKAEEIETFENTAEPIEQHDILRVRD